MSELDDTQNEFPIQEPENDGSDSGQNTTQDPLVNYKPSGFTAWIIAGLATTVSIVASVLFTDKVNQIDTIRKDFSEYKVEAKITRKDLSKRADSLQRVVNECENTTLDALQIQFDKARKLRLTAISDASKLEEQVDIAKQNAQMLKTATQNIKKETNK